MSLHSSPLFKQKKKKMQNARIASEKPIELKSQVNYGCFCIYCYFPWKKVCYQKSSLGEIVPWRKKSRISVD